MTVAFAVQPVVGGFLPTSVCSSSGASTKIESPRVSLVPLPLAWTLKLNVPLCVGVPEMTPFEASVRPGGSVPPASDHEFTVSPDACRAGAVYAWLRFASGRLGVVTVELRLGRRAAIDVDRVLLVGEDPRPCRQSRSVYDTVM